MFDKWFELGEQPYTEEDAEWDAFVATHPNGTVLQTDSWARLKNRFGWSSQRIWLRHEGQLVAGAQILFRARAVGMVKMGYIPHGPLVDWSNKEQVQVLFNQIDIAAYRNRVGFVKIEPLLWQSEQAEGEWETFCQQLALQPDSDTIQPPQTILIDLRPSVDEILANMKQKTRYNIRLSTKKGVTVRKGTEKDLPHFIRLMHITGQRDGFGVRVPQYYKAAYELFAPQQVALFLAEYETKPLCGIMVFRSGTHAVYLFGASSNEERNRMPAYAAQWAAIQWAKAQGCTHYDMGGIPDASLTELEANFTKRHDGLWGVYRFKRGFGGEIQRTVGASDRVYNKLVYRLYRRGRG